MRLRLHWIAGLTVLMFASSSWADRRESALAGTWYPADPARLAELVDNLLDAQPAAPSDAPIRALLAPHAAYAYSGDTAAAAVARVRARSYRRVIVLAPSHRGAFEGLSIAAVDAYKTPLGQIELDGAAVADLRRSPLVHADPLAHTREHAIEIQLPMLQRALEPGWRLVPVLVGRLDRDTYREAAELLRRLADDGTLIVVSSDFTHFGPRFGYVPFPIDSDTPGRIEQLDMGAAERIEALDADGFINYRTRTGASICGHWPIALLLAMLPADARVERLAYARSGDMTGGWEHSVSYMAFLVTSERPLSSGESTAAPERMRLLHDVAVLGVELAVLGQSAERIEQVQRTLDAMPHELNEPSGAFVTLTRDGELRGCIGYVQAHKPLVRAVLENGFNAAVRDRRFPPVTPKELATLDIEVSVLSPMRPIPSVEDFRVGEEGIVLSKSGKTAVFLPEVARDQGWSREETLSNLSRKAGLPADAWREGASFEVFTSMKYAAPYPN